MRPARNPRRFTDEEAVALVQRFGLEPLVPYPGSMTKKWSCKCIYCDLVVESSLNTVFRASEKIKNDNAQCTVGHNTPGIGVMPVDEWRELLANAVRGGSSTVKLVLPNQWAERPRGFPPRVLLYIYPEGNHVFEVDVVRLIRWVAWSDKNAVASTQKRRQ